MIGTSAIRKEAREKVTGRALYIDDIKFNGMLHGATVRSKIARGHIKQINFKPGMPWDEFTIVTAKNITGKNHVALIMDDQPFLAETAINHAEEPILLLAHHEKDLVEEARNHIDIEIEPTTPVLTIEEALLSNKIIKSIRVVKGDFNKALSEADHIIDGEYTTGLQETLYIENHGIIAVADPQKGITVWGSMQCPYYVHKALVGLFGLPKDKIRVIQTETGGGFGGKEDYPSLIAGHAALLAWKSGKPVKMIYDRSEDMAATTKRHPSRTRHRTALTKDGRIIGMEIDFVIDGGAYATVSPVVLSRGTLHATGPYYCPNISITSSAVRTNTPPNGAFRGFGAPQSLFAIERHMDKIAMKLGITPDEIRRRNFIRDGETTATGQLIRDRVDMVNLLERALELSGYRNKLESFKTNNLKNHIKKGIGLAAFMHGAGFTGSGEKFLASVVSVEVTPVEVAAGGKVRVLASSTEIGQGTNTIFSQIAAEALGIGLEEIEVVRPDTAIVPDSGPTVASRTCMVVGKLVQSACEALKQMLIQGGFLPEKYSQAVFRQACANYIEKFGKLKASSQYKQPSFISWDDESYRGDAYAAFSWAVYVAEVSVDTHTFQTTVDRFTALQDIGRVINPVLAEGQIQGGITQGIGYTLYENVIRKNGRMINNQLSNYIIPTAADVPDTTVFFEETPYENGPGGAKGIGELPMDGPAPAILMVLSLCAPWA
ncbi:MAG: xanthine dehydrogenase family protein molybdopterin-binding subunit, partial [Bdellovibrionota bacterium]